MNGIKSRIINNNRGLTVMELLIAVAIVGVVFTLVASFFKLSVTVYDEGYDRTEEQHAVRLASDIIAREVRNAYYVSVQNDTSGTDTADVDDLYLYVNNDNRLVKYNKYSGNEMFQTLGDLEAQGVEFSIRVGDVGYFLDYTVTSEDGYSVSSSVLLNNIDDITEVNGVNGGVKHYLWYTKP